MKTIKIPYNVDTDARSDYDQVLGELRRIQSSVYHVAYNQAALGLAEIDIRGHCRGLFPDLDSWILQSAIKKGIGQFKADHELAKLQNRSFKGNRVFGGRKNLKRRNKGLITNEEWKVYRLESLYLIGESLPKGNRKFEFHTNSISFKPMRGIAFELVLPNLHGNYQNDYLNLVELTTNKGIPVTVTLNDKFIWMSYDDTKLETNKPKKIIKGRHLGIDLNPNYIGVSYYDECNRLLDTQLFNFKELTGKNINADKLKHEIREVAIAIGKKSQHYQIEYLFVEDLSFKQGNKGKGKWFNRLTQNQFLVNEFNRMIAKYGKVVKVNAAYSSTIGNIMNNQFPDPVAASMEIARRGIESRVVKGSNRFYPPLVSKEELAGLWKDLLVPDFETWIELHNWLKATGVKYRVPIPSIDMFRLFSSKPSKVLVY